MMEIVEILKEMGLSFIYVGAILSYAVGVIGMSKLTLEALVAITDWKWK